MGLKLVGWLRTLLTCMHRWKRRRIRCRCLRVTSTDPERPPGSLCAADGLDSAGQGRPLATVNDASKKNYCFCPLVSLVSIYSDHLRTERVFLLRDRRLLATASGFATCRTPLPVEFPLLKPSCAPMCLLPRVLTTTTEAFVATGGPLPPAKSTEEGLLPSTKRRLAHVESIVERRGFA